MIVLTRRKRFYDTGLLGDRYAGNKFAEYLFRRHDAPPADHTRDQAYRIVEEAHVEVAALLQKNRDKLDSLAHALLEHETLDEDEAYAAAGVERQPVDTPRETAAAAQSVTPAPGR